MATRVALAEVYVREFTLCGAVAADVLRPDVGADAYAFAVQVSAGAASPPAVLLPVALPTSAVVAARLRRNVLVSVAHGRSVLVAVSADTAVLSCSLVHRSGRDVAAVATAHIRADVGADDSVPKLETRSPLLSLAGQHVGDVTVLYRLHALPSALAAHMASQLRLEHELYTALLHGELHGPQELRQMIFGSGEPALASPRERSGAPHTSSSAPSRVLGRGHTIETSVSTGDRADAAHQPPPLFYANIPHVPLAVIGDLPPAREGSTAGGEQISPTVDSDVSPLDALLCRWLAINILQRQRSRGRSSSPHGSGLSLPAARLVHALQGSSAHWAESMVVDNTDMVSIEASLRKHLPQAMQLLTGVANAPLRPHSPPRPASPVISATPPPAAAAAPPPVPMPPVHTTSIDTSTPSTVRLSRALRIKLAAREEQRRVRRLAGLSQGSTDAPNENIPPVTSSHHKPSPSLPPAPPIAPPIAPPPAPPVVRSPDASASMFVDASSIDREGSADEQGLQDAASPSATLAHVLQQSMSLSSHTHTHTHTSLSVSDGDVTRSGELHAASSPSREPSELPAPSNVEEQAPAHFDPSRTIRNDGRDDAHAPVDFTRTARDGVLDAFSGTVRIPASAVA